MKTMRIMSGGILITMFCLSSLWAEDLASPFRHVVQRYINKGNRNRLDQPPIREIAYRLEKPENLLLYPSQRKNPSILLPKPFDPYVNPAPLLGGNE